MFNKTVLQNNVIKKVAILTAVASFFLVGCGSDQNYKREVDGNDDYLNSPSLKPLIVPQGITVPAEVADYFVNNGKIDGPLGKQVDIRPPVLPLSTISEAFVIYNNGMVTFNVPLSYNIWDRIPNILTNKNIPIDGRDNQTIKTAKAYIVRADESQQTEASYVFKRKIMGNTETITLGLNSLTRGAEDISTQPAEVQRYVVGLFNIIMDEVAPESVRQPPVKNPKDDDAKKDAKSDKDSESMKALKEDLKDNNRR